MNEIWELTEYTENTAVLDESGDSLSYAELERQSEALHEALGCRFLILCACSNTIGSLIGYVSFLNNGNVPMLVSASLGTEQMKKLIDHYHPSYMWLPAGKENEYPEYTRVYEAYGYVLLKTGEEKDYEMDPSLALLLSTSGSTGSPKFVRITYENIRSNTASIVDYLHITDSERAITTLPMNYTYGLSVINTHLSKGARLLMTESSLMQKSFWNFFKEAGATSLAGVPYTYEMLDKLRFSRMELPTLKTMTQAGGRLSEELQQKFAALAQEKNISFYVMYGQCEATARMAYLPPEMALEKKGSFGIAIPKGKLYITDESGEVINTPHVPGELVYEGKNVTPGYAEDRTDLIKPDERNGRLETGDIAEFDEDGYFYMVGRKKRFLKVFGNRVNLDELDMLINSRFNTRVVCAGRDDEVYIFTTEESAADAVREYASQTTGLNQSAFHVKVLPEIPMNESGKVLYRELEKHYEL